MGADRTVRLTRKITDKEVEQIFRKLDMEFSRQSWGYSSELDVKPNKDKIEFHYGYCGEAHCTNALWRTEQIIRELEEKGLVKKIGKWNY